MANSPPVPNTTTAIATIPSFNLIHKCLTHPGKDALHLMIQKKLVNGVDNISNDAKGFNCMACIWGKMTCGPFSRLAMRQLLSAWANFTPMFVVLWTYHPLGKNHYFCMLIDNKTQYLWFLPCSNKLDFSCHGLSNLTTSLPTTMVLA